MSRARWQLGAVGVFVVSALLAALLAGTHLGEESEYRVVMIDRESVGPELRGLAVEESGWRGAAGTVADDLEVQEAELDRPRDALERAVSLRRSGDPEAAVALLEDVLAKEPGVAAPVLAELGAALIACERLEEAEARLAKVLETAPGDVRSIYNLGVVYSKQGRLSRARETYERVLDLSPNHTRALFNLGMADYRAGRFEVAESWFERLLEVDRTERAAKACFQLGAIAAETGREDRAVHWYREAVRRRPDYAEARNNLALVLEDVGRESEAIEALRKAAALEPVNAAAHYNLGRLLSDRGEVEAGIDALTVASETDPDLVKAHLTLAELLQETGRHDRAVAPLERAFGAGEGGAEVAERLAEIHRRHERYDQAELWLRRAVELRPTLGRLWNALGIVQARLDEPERAAGSYRRSIELEPSQAAARFNLGLLLEREGEQGDAARRFREVLERDPRHVGARRHLVKILVDRDAPEALEAARKLARVAGDDPKALATAGYAFLKGDRPDLAAGALERSLMVDPSSQAVRFNLGLAQLRLDRPGAASETFEELLERWPGDPKTRRFLERARERVREAR